MNCSGQVSNRSLEAALRATGLGKNELRERKKVEAAMPVLKAYLEKRYPDIAPVSFDVGWEVEHGAASIKITPRPGSAARTVTVQGAPGGTFSQPSPGR